MFSKLFSFFEADNQEADANNSFDSKTGLNEEYSRFSDLFPWTGCWEKERLFAIEGEKEGSIVAIGYCIELNPQTGASADMSRLLQEIYRDMPVGTGVQMQLYGSPDIETFLNNYQGVVNSHLLETEEQRQLMQRVANARVKHYRKAAIASTIPSRPSVMRHYRVFLSVSIPVKKDDDATIDKILELRESQISKLKTYYQFNKIFQAEDLIALVRTMLNPAQRLNDAVDYDSGRELRYQILYRDTKVDVDEQGLTLSSSDGHAVCVRGLSVINYAKKFDLHQVAQMLGDSTQGSKGYPCPFLITMGAQVIDFEEHKNTTQLKTARAIQVAESPMAKVLPDVVKRADDWRSMQNSYDEGGGGIRLYHQVLMFPQPEKATQADEAAKAVWRSMGFTLTSDTYMQTQALMSSLPMALSPVLLKDISNAQRLSTKRIEDAANLSPILGEWSGVGSPVLSFTGRNGQVIGVDLFSNPSGNYNFCVVGTSGSGKSAFLNELATRYLAMGAKVWIIDVGRSYEKLCKSLGGQYIEFTKEANVILNPFTMVKDINEDMEMLKPLLAQMISPSRRLSDYELSQLEVNVRNLWDQYGQTMTIDLLAERLKLATGDGSNLLHDESGEFDPRIKDLGVQLQSYTSNGSYGKYFTGEHTVNFNSNMVVLELEELKSKKDLQAVALFILMYRITQEMYLAPREQPKVVILDEAWDLLTGGQSGEFIEAGYRRARKYGGAFGTGTQGINDYDRSPASIAARENADWMFMLRQKQESIAKLEEKLAFTPHMKDLVASLRTEQGSYSEIFVSCGQAGYGVGVLSMDRFSQLMGSANARDFTAVRDKQASGMTMAEAIDAVLKDRGVYEQ